MKERSFRVEDARFVFVLFSVPAFLFFSLSVREDFDLLMEPTCSTPILLWPSPCFLFFAYAPKTFPSRRNAVVCILPPYLRFVLMLTKRYSGLCARHAAACSAAPEPENVCSISLTFNPVPRCRNVSALIEPAPFPRCKDTSHPSVFANESLALSILRCRCG